MTPLEELQSRIQRPTPGKQRCTWLMSIIPSNQLFTEDGWLYKILRPLGICLVYWRTTRFCDANGEYMDAVRELPHELVGLGITRGKFVCTCGSTATKYEDEDDLDEYGTVFCDESGEWLR